MARKAKISPINPETENQESTMNTETNTENTNPVTDPVVVPVKKERKPRVTKDHDGRKLSPSAFVTAYMGEYRENPEGTMESLSARIKRDLGLNVPAEVLVSRTASYKKLWKESQGLAGISLPKLGGVGQARKGRVSTIDWSGLQALAPKPAPETDK